MSDRPSPPAQTPTPPRTPTQPRPTQGNDGATSQPAPGDDSRGPRPQGPPPAPSSAGSDSGPGDTAVRVGLAERIQAKLASATGKNGGDDADPATGKTASPAASPALAPAPVKKSRPRGPRRARLRLTRIDPWSVMKTSFLLSIAFGVVTVIAVAMIWQVIDAAGVWTSINKAINDVVTEPGNPAFDIRDYVGTDRVLGFTMLVAAVDVVLITAIATLGAFLYNMSAALLGGIEVTLAEDS